MTPEENPLEEPSVLDYLKERLKFWKRGEKITLHPGTEGVSRPGKVSEAAEAKPAREPDPDQFRLGSLPWRSLAAMVFALLGQRAWEPSANRTATTGLVLYFIALAFLVWAALAREWNLRSLPETGAGVDPMRVRPIQLIAGVILAIAAFATLGGNLFTLANVALWVLAIFCFAWAFWLPRPQAVPDRAKAVESGPFITGNVLDNDKLRNVPAALTYARQDKKRIKIGAPFTTAAGGTLTLDADGAYRYTPPVQDALPPQGLTEHFRYILTDGNGEKASSTLTINVSDSGPVPAARPSLWKRLWGFFSRGSWQVIVTRWALLVLLVTGVVFFFRVYSINGVPSEPFSDHAEKILDVYDVSQGQTHIFFPRNTGREAIQMYLTLVVSWVFGTGLSFLSLKIGTVICGLLTLPYIYLLGKEFGGKRVGLLALFFAGIAYWPNVISRVGLRFPLYPLFVAPVLYYLLRGLRNRSRNDMIVAGLFLGFGLHGYSPFRIVPIVVVIAIALYLLHRQSRGGRLQAVSWLAILALVSLIVFLPLLRYWLDNPTMFSFRAFSRLGGTESPLPGPAWKIFFSNLWNGLRMFNWDDGEIWVHSVPHRPALDVISGALFLIGVVLVLIRYIRQRHWQDLFLLLAVPLLQLPSILSLAFPAENPALNRAGGAVIPVFLLVALALDGLMSAFEPRSAPAEGVAESRAARTNRTVRTTMAWVLVFFLAIPSAMQNYNLVFNKFSAQFTQGAWNSSEMGEVIKQFGETYGTTDTAWIVPFPYWVDTRLPGVWAGIPNRDFAIWPNQFESSVPIPGPKMFILNGQDNENVAALEQLYPQGVMSTFHSATKMEGKDFFIFFVPPSK